jgi:hypothetical protein
MPITVFCQECGKQYLAKEEQAGMRVRCPAGHIMQVPAASPFADQTPVDPAYGDPTQINPYASPGYQAGGYAPVAPFNKGKVIAPAIALIVVGTLGIGMSIFSAAMALVGEAPQVDPEMPEFFREFQRGGFGPMAAVLQLIFIGVNVVLVAGAIQMLRLKTWTFALVSSILAMINFGSCCCLVGLPVGIWSLVILLQNDVKAAFMQQARV